MPRLTCLIRALVVIALLSTASGAVAQEYRKDHLVIDKVWARTTIPDRPGATYLMINNSGESNDRLIAARTPSAARAELHGHSMEDGVMKMRKVEAVQVPSGAAAELKPGGFHVMLFGLAKPLAEGEEFPLTLTFEKAGDIAIVVKVKGMAAKSMEHGDHDKSHMKMD